MTLPILKWRRHPDKSLNSRRDGLFFRIAEGRLGVVKYGKGTVHEAFGTEVELKAYAEDFRVTP